ncbi:MAG: hypothetical protein QXE76_04750 [Candidatus Bathyarchaeia archaeon]
MDTLEIFSITIFYEYNHKFKVIEQIFRKNVARKTKNLKICRKISVKFCRYSKPSLGAIIMKIENLTLFNQNFYIFPTTKNKS